MGATLASWEMENSTGMKSVVSGAHVGATQLGAALARWEIETPHP